MNRKEYYVIQNNQGRFFKVDNASGGYPCFISSFEFCEKYDSKQYVEDFLKGDYVNRMFKDEFQNCVIRKVTMILE